MDLIKYFEDRNVEYSKSGRRNIGAGWLGLQVCPYCNSPNFHFGVNLKNGSYNCWICNEKGNFIKLIREFDKCSYNKAKKIAEEYGYSDPNIDNSDEERPKNKIENVLPKEANDNFLKVHLDWLEGRNFNPQYLIKKYSLKATQNLGKYRFKIIVPVIMDRQVVSFIAADPTGQAKSKYLFPRNEDVEKTIGECVYNIDSVKEGGEAIVTEGCTDVWRLGDKAVALLGKRITKEQLSVFARKELERVTIVPDEGAEESAEKIANQLSGIIDNVEICYLEAGDPGDLSVDEVLEFRKHIGI